MLKKKRPPIVNSVTRCVNNNWPDHKWVLDIEACPQDLIWFGRDETYYPEAAVKDQIVFKRRILIRFFKMNYKAIHKQTK